MRTNRAGYGTERTGALLRSGKVSEEMIMGQRSEHETFVTSRALPTSRSSRIPFSLSTKQGCRASSEFPNAFRGQADNMCEATKCKTIGTSGNCGKGNRACFDQCIEIQCFLKSRTLWFKHN